MATDNRAGEPRLTLLYVLTLGLLAALLRAIPYWLPDWGPITWNLMPVGALALFAGSRLRSPRAWLVPLGVMLVADLLLLYPLAQMGHSAFSPVVTPIVYLSFAAYVALGRLVGEGELSPLVIGGAALLGGVQFFLLTNFAVWLSGGLYPATPEGLLTCYLAGIPYYKNTLAADLLFAGLIFGGHAALLRAWRATAAAPALAPARQDEVRP